MNVEGFDELVDAVALALAERLRAGVAPELEAAIREVATKERDPFRAAFRRECARFKREAL